MLKNKLGFTLAVASFAIPMMVSAQVSTTPVIPSTSTSGLIVSMTTPAGAVNGGTNVNLGTIRLDATGLTPITVYSIPVMANYTGPTGAVTADDLTNCRLINNATGATLNTGRNLYTALFNGSNVINLDTPLVVNPGTPVMLSLNCDVTARSGGGLQLTVAPTAFPANSVVTSNGTSVTPTAGVTASGTAAPTTGSVVFTGVGSTPVVVTPPVVVVVPTTPGLPNTGFGGNALASYAMLAALAALATGGFLMRRNLSLK